jgi:hypothetical protein
MQERPNIGDIAYNTANITPGKHYKMRLYFGMFLS